MSSLFRGQKEEKREERPRVREARRHAQSRRRNRLAAVAVGAALLVIALAVIFGRGKGQETAEKTDVTVVDNSPGPSLPTETDTDTGSSEAPSEESAESSEEAAPSEETDEGEAEEDEEDPQFAYSDIFSSETPDRSTFAVDPSNTDWNYGPMGEKTIYLTFDDGPSYLTPQVLDILDQYGVKATFFVTAQNPEYFDYIADAYNRGHTIGLHSACHDYEQIYTSVDAYLADLAEIGQVVEDQIGYVPCFIRFPGGSSNTVSANYCEGIMTELTARVQEMGYQYWDWNTGTGDGEEVTAEQELEEVQVVETEDKTAVVLLAHDGELKESTVEALPGIIEYYQALGYVFRPLDRNAKVIHHTVFN